MVIGCDGYGREREVLTPEWGSFSVCIAALGSGLWHRDALSPLCCLTIFVLQLSIRNHVLIGTFAN